MKLFEYQGRDLLARAGVPVPKGAVVSSPAEFDQFAAQLEYPVVIKAQVLVGGRGKAGGVQFADDARQGREHVVRMLGMTIRGHVARQLLIQRKLDFQHEFYASVLIDRATRKPMVMVSADGGVEIESVPDERIHRVHVNPLTGFEPFHARRLTRKMGLDGDIAKQVGDILGKLYRCFVDNDAELVEVNPLALTREGRVVAADAKVLLNDAARYRHPDVTATDEDLTPLEAEAKRAGIAFVQLDGDIGVIANGAGLTMATLDALTHYGGRGGTFLDLGGTDDAEKVKACFRLLQRAQPRVILLNLFGGITKSDTVARGVRTVIDETGLDVPLVTRIKGVNEEEARGILADAGVHTAETLQEAAQMAVRLAKGAA